MVWRNIYWHDGITTLEISLKGGEELELYVNLKLNLPSASNYFTASFLVFKTLATSLTKSPLFMFFSFHGNIVVSRKYDRAILF